MSCSKIVYDGVCRAVLSVLAVVVFCSLVFFFFKQKTAYEI